MRAEEDWQGTKPFSLLYLAAALRAKYYDVRIVDLETPAFREKPLEYVFRNDSSVIFGITATTYTRFEAIAVARAIRKEQPDALIIVGGVHFMHCAEETLSKVKEIDIVVRGEGEITIVEIADAVSAGRSWQGIKGITYEKDGIVVNNPDQDCLVDIDNLHPLYQEYSWDEYPEYLYGVEERIKAISVVASRGCPYQCIFCAKQGTGYRVRNVRSIVDEIQVLRNRFSANAVNFLDLSLTASPKHVRELCSEIKARSLDIAWWCESRVNIPLELLEEMRGAGCASLAIGVESGSEKVLSRLNKRITRDQVISFCKKCSSLNIKVQCYFMYSHPDETESDVLDTLQFMTKLRDVAVCNIQPTMIFPGTELEKLAREKGLMPPDFSWALPYESSLNIELGQLSNCPLYIDAIPVDFMRRVRSLQIEMGVSKRYSEMSFWQILAKMYDHFITHRRSLPDFVTWSFLKRVIAEKRSPRMRNERGSLYDS